MKLFLIFTIKELWHLAINNIAYKLQTIVDKDIVRLKMKLDRVINSGFNIKKTNIYYVFYDNSLKIYNRIKSSDNDVFIQIFVEDEYAPIKNICEQKGIRIRTILDCGANIGISSIYFKNQFPEARICAIEPFLENINMINLNFKENHLNATVVHGAIWNKMCRLSINRSFRDGKEWSVNMVERKGFGDIEAHTISSIMTDISFDTIDLLKIDVEGAEKYIFDKDISDVTFLKHTKIIAIEIHDEFECRDQICNLLIENDFELIESGELTIGINQKTISQ